MGVLAEIQVLVLEGGFIPSVKKKVNPKQGKLACTQIFYTESWIIPPKIGIFMD